jgi:hypothetical protein
MWRVVLAGSSCVAPSRPGRWPLPSSYGDLCLVRISREIKTDPATSEEAQLACREMNERCEVRRLNPPVKVDG